MLIRKFVIAGLVLAAMGLAVTVTTGVIGQQPGAGGKSDDVVEKAVPAPGGATDPTKDADAVAAPAADDSLPRVPGKTSAGTAATADEGGGISAPAAGVGAAPAGATKARGKSSGKTRSDSAMGGPRNGAGMMAPGGGGMGMPGMPGMGGMSGMPGMPGMMPGMSGSGSTAAVPEDERLEAWVSRALAEYAQTEDVIGRKKQREEISKALDRIFDIRQERRMEELETLEQRVQKLRVTLETREKLKSEILKNRVDYLIREADGLGWGDGIPALGRSAPTGMRPAGGARSGGSGTSSTGSR